MDPIAGNHEIAGNHVWLLGVGDKAKHMRCAVRFLFILEIWSSGFDDALVTDEIKLAVQTSETRSLIFILIATFPVHAG